MTKTNTTDVYQIVTDRIIAELEKGIIPWNKPWTGMAGGAYSRATGKPYSLLNQMLLKHTGEYLTFKQALEAGGSVRKGEKGEQVFFWKMVKVTEKNANNEPEEKTVPYLRYYTVFHISQCDGVEPKYQPEAGKPFDPIRAAEHLAAAYAGRENLRIEHEQGDQAYYAPRRDLIHMPLKEQFTGSSEYYSTLFHELTHSTGHKSRLNRFAENEAPAAFGSADYSKEELVAEIGAASLLNLIGAEVASNFKNSVAYIQSWLKVLKGDKRFIVSAAGKAEKAVNFIIGEEGLDFPEGPAPQPPTTETEDQQPAAVPATFNSPALALKDIYAAAKKEFTTKAAAYLKNAIKQEEILSVTTGEDGYIYIINDYMAFKIPACLYSSLIQPITLREAPAPGQCFGAKHGKTAQDYLNIWNNLLEKATTPAILTPYTKREGKKNMYIFSVEGKPAFVTSKLMECLGYDSMTFRGSTTTGGIHAQGAAIEAIIMPLHVGRVSEADTIIAEHAHNIAN